MPRSGVPMSELDRDIPIERFAEVDSTSLLARRRIAAGDLGIGPVMLLADRQTGGLGRFGRSWASPAGGVWATLVWPLTRDRPGVLDGLGLRLAVACAAAIEHELAALGGLERVRIKWPNDVLIDGKKVLGVLTEVVHHDGRPILLVGVGVNADFAGRELPTDLRARATTLRDILGRSPNVPRLIDDLHHRLRDAILEEGLPAGVLAEARDRLFGVGETAVVRLNSGQGVAGVLVGLNDEGLPILETAGGRWTAPPGADLAPGPAAASAR